MHLSCKGINLIMTLRLLRWLFCAQNLKEIQRLDWLMTTHILCQEICLSNPSKSMPFFLTYTAGTWPAPCSHHEKRTSRMTKKSSLSISGLWNSFPLKHPLTCVLCLRTLWDRLWLGDFVHNSPGLNRNSHKRIRSWDLVRIGIFQF